ncbi:hypothetical protein ACH4TP_24565 [Streptomyces sp. NPDC021012]|uniref:hypothetical protein n=1 Tax=Streptomyces sp. NPDC021012 TaxID=3365107 RepID=UPI003798D163
MGGDRKKGDAAMRGERRTPGGDRAKRIRGRSPEPDQLNTGGRPVSPDEVVREHDQDATMHDVMHDVRGEDPDDTRGDR